MKRKIKIFGLKPFRPFPHKMERRMKRGYRKCAALNLSEARLNCDGAGLEEYEKWLMNQTEI